MEQKLLQKLTVAHLVKVFRAFHEKRTYFFHKSPLLDSILKKLNSVQILTVFNSIQFNSCLFNSCLFACKLNSPEANYKVSTSKGNKYKHLQTKYK
jgi:hypothetical protein